MRPAVVLADADIMFARAFDMSSLLRYVVG